MRKFVGKIIIVQIALICLFFSFKTEAKDPGKIQSLFEDFGISERLRKTVEPAAMELLSRLKSKGSYTYGHRLRVGKYSQALAKEMKFPSDFLENIFIEGILHDVGKLQIPDTILNKPGKLTEEEFQKIKDHPIIGEGIIQSNSVLFKYSKGAKEPHERWDGKGYPTSLKGENISLEGRIIAVSDAFDAMTSQRRYGKPKNLEEAIRELEEKKGSQFAPQIIEAFLSAVKKGAIKIEYSPPD